MRGFWCVREPELLVMLQSDDPVTRRRGARGLGYRRSVEAAPALRAALDDADSGVARAARWALSTIASGR